MQFKNLFMGKDQQNAPFYLKVFAGAVHLEGGVVVALAIVLQLLV